MALHDRWVFRSFCFDIFCPDDGGGGGGSNEGDGDGRRSDDGCVTVLMLKG